VAVAQVGIDFLGLAALDGLWDVVEQAGLGGAVGAAAI
jgi:hypothetical protein